MIPREPIAAKSEVVAAVSPRVISQRAGEPHTAAAPGLDPEREVAELLDSLSARPWGQLSPSVYETGRLVSLAPWLAGHDQRLTFLLAAQRADGGWGGPDGYGLVPTLSATEALITTLRRASSDDRFGPGWSGRLADAAHLGIAALSGWLNHPGRLSLPDTPAVEILVPSLVEALNRHLAELRDLPVDPAGTLAGLAQFRSGPRLALPQGVDESLLSVVGDHLAAGTPLPEKILHSLEVVGHAARGAAVRLVAPGTVGASPAATAAWLGDPPAEPAALVYLEAATRAHGGPVSSIVPVTFFERSWVLDHLLVSGLAPNVPDEVTQSLAGAVGPDGSPGGAGLPPDADTTSVAILTLSRLGAPVDLTPLRRYERATHFVTWDGERTPSTTTNAHALETFGGLAHAAGSDDGDVGRRAVLDKVAGWLREQQREDGSWIDKWHASPFYATTAVAGALSRFGGAASQPAVDRALRWLLASQRADGSWGSWTGTAEETAYGLQLLLRTRVSGPRAERDTIRAASRALAFVTRSARHDHPPLWHDKDLYAPYAVVRSAILGAIHLARSTLPKWALSPSN